ncbi:MAG TPA: hypothetical protein VG937_08340 [Polyangiaceae bacterium]|nr:hypothetical protein [Polyangiaceae bacterium]
MLAHGAHHASGRFAKPLALGILTHEAQDAANVRFCGRNLGGFARRSVFFLAKRGRARLFWRWHWPRSMPSDAIALNANPAEARLRRKILSQLMKDSVAALNEESRQKSVLS